jgi:hypothetical protein
MKKILNISVIAALAILPMAANAAVGEIVPGAPTNITKVPVEQATVQTAENVTAGDGPKYALALEGANDSNVATAGYVKGAYNAAIRAINKVSETASGALTADGQATLTNKTIDANGTGNSITNLETDNFNSAALATSTGIKTDNTASDTKLVTEKAVATAINGMVTETGTQTLTNKNISGGTVQNAAISGGTVSGATITGGTIDADSTTISNLEADNFKACTVVNSTTGIAAEFANADDNKLVTEKAVRKAIDDLSMDTYATTTGAAATAAAAVNGATVTYDLNGLGVQTGAVTGTANAKITVMDTWGSETPATNQILADVDLTQTQAVTGLTGNTAGKTATISAGTVTYKAN